MNYCLNLQIWSEQVQSRECSQNGSWLIPRFLKTCYIFYCLPLLKTLSTWLLVLLQKLSVAFYNGNFPPAFSRALMICRFRKSKPLLSLSDAGFILFMQNLKILKYKEAISCEGSVGLASIHENFLISHTCIRIRKLFSFGYYSQGTFSLCNLLFWYGVGLEIMLFKKIYIFIWFCFQVFYYSMFL